MNARQLILERRSVRSYTDQPVPSEMIEEILEAAIYAPNHKLREPWRFVLAIGEGQVRYVEQLMELLEARGQFDKKTDEQRLSFKEKISAVPVFLTVLYHVQGTDDQQTEDLLATAAMIQNIQLLASELGLGSCWKSGKHWFTDEYATLVGAHDEERVAGVIQLGWPAMIPPLKKRTPAREKLTHF